jgi:hypothetical protein
MPPRILPRPEHTLSRKGIDADALKVLYRLKNHGFIAYLVGGGVRDLLLGRKPKDFDISTDAHPQQVKKLFKNCFVVGRRFRLCHVRFGRKVVEVSTFRRLAEGGDEDGLIRRDNTFGNPEEDAFRRDFTVNALFYDIATFSIIDFVGGLEDLEKRTIRSIGDPGVRFREDPVRMLRAVALAARLGFSIDPDSVEAIRALRGEILKSSPARLVEEMFKVLRSGAALRTFGMLHEHGLLAYLLPEVDRAVSERNESLRLSLDRLDAWRAAGGAPEEMTNPVLLGSLFAPLGAVPKRARVPAARRPVDVPDPEGDEGAEADEPVEDVGAEMAALGGVEEEIVAPHPLVLLPFARRDVDRMRLVLAAQPRLRELHRTPRVRHLLAGRHYLDEALRWLEIHGGEEERGLAAEWRALPVSAPPADDEDAAPSAAGNRLPEAEDGGPRRRRRRRRRRPSGSSARTA